MIKKIPLIPNAITAFGLTCGLFVIFKVNMVDPGEGTYEGLLFTTVLLMLAGMADMLDGIIARAMKAESEFGEFFDSLADSIAFGVAPSVIVLKSLSVRPGTEFSFVITLCAMIFSLCGILRLARFNMTKRALHGVHDLELAHQKNFTGLPIPAGAAALVSLNLFLFSPKAEAFFVTHSMLRAMLLLIAMSVLGYFMISRWKFPSLKTLQVRVTSFHLVLFVGISAVITFYGILYRFPMIFVIASWGYVVIGWLLSLLRIIAGRRSHRLEDFEPEEIASSSFES